MSGSGASQLEKSRACGDIILVNFEIQGHANPDFYPKIPHFCQFKGMHGMQGMQAKTPLNGGNHQKRGFQGIFDVFLIKKLKKSEKIFKKPEKSRKIMKIHETDTRWSVCHNEYTDLAQNWSPDLFGKGRNR